MRSSYRVFGRPSCSLGCPCGSTGKEPACNAGDLGSIPGSGRSPGEGHGNPLQYSSLDNPYGQRSLAGYSPWGHTESDTTERLTLSLSNRLNFPKQIIHQIIDCFRYLNKKCGQICIFRTLLQ